MRKWFCIVFCSAGVLCLAQNRYTDSLEKVNAALPEGKEKMHNLAELSSALQSMNAEQAMLYADSALALSKKLNNKQMEAFCLNLRGDALWYEGDYALAQEEYFRALGINESINDSTGIAAAYRDLGWVFYSLNEFDRALDYFLKAYVVNKRRKEHHGICENCNDLAIIYRIRKDFTKALQFIEEGVDQSKIFLNNKDLETMYGSQSLIYQDQGKFGKAIEYLKKALEISESNGHTTVQIGCYINIAAVFNESGKAPDGIPYLEKVVTLAEKMNYRNAVSESYLGLASAYEVRGDYKQAFIYHKKYRDIKDSLLNVENNRQMTEMQAKYETEKKDKKLIQKDKALNAELAEAKRKSFQRNIFMTCFGLTVILALFIYRSYRLKKLANFKLKKQKEIIEEKQTEILDSIYYARRIQRVLLTSERYIGKTLTRLKAQT